MAAVLASRKRCASALDEPVRAPAHLAKRGRFSPAPAAFMAHQQQQAAARADGDNMVECAGVLVDEMSAAADLVDARTRTLAILKLIDAAVTKRASESASAEAAALRGENGVLRARVLELDRDNGVLKRGVAEQYRRQEALERDNGVLRHGVAALHRRDEEAKREAAELRKKVAELEATNYALAARMLGTDSCRFQAFHGPDVF